MKLTYVGFRAHVKIASRIVSYRVSVGPRFETTGRIDRARDDDDAMSCCSETMRVCVSVGTRLCCAVG